MAKAKFCKQCGTELYKDGLEKGTLCAMCKKINAGGHVRIKGDLLPQVNEIANNLNVTVSVWVNYLIAKELTEQGGCKK